VCHPRHWGVKRFFCAWLLFGNGLTAPQRLIVAPNQTPKRLDGVPDGPAGLKLR